MAKNETVNDWERLMACCFSWGFVWYKEGPGSMCCVNCLLGAFLGTCCVNVCHACSYVGEPPKLGSPEDFISKQAVITKQPL